MKKSTINLLLILPLLGAVMLFHACPIIIGKAESQEVKPYQRPSWAVNKPGSIDLLVSDVDAIVDYTVSQGYETEYTLSYSSSVYTGEKDKKYKVDYIIGSSFGIIEQGSNSTSEAYYESLSGIFYPDTADIKKFKFVIPANLSGIIYVKLYLIYNVSDLKTKILIPLDVKKPPSGISEISSNISIFYSASPLVPSNNTAFLQVTPRIITVNFNITDAVGCLAGYTRIQPIQYTAKVKYGSSYVNSEGFINCKPSYIKSIPANITCIIEIYKDNNIYKAFSLGEVHLDLEFEIDKYSCSFTREYIINIRKYEE
ncbi:hypothetical protein BA065_01065 [Nanoarchaeota archaeon NZ13-N]|nr:MAG: hypothetical protein BA065_01065 [Nanoarchaeota archaeon NZ13-N]